MTRRRGVALLATMTMLIGLLLTASPVSATCSSLGVQVYDGSGHTYTFYSTGTCTNPTFAKTDLNQFAATCIGNFGINQGDESDCANSMRLFGDWPGNTYAIFTYQDVGLGGRSDGVIQERCDGTQITPLAHVDEMTSFIVQQTSLQCT